LTRHIGAGAAPGGCPSGFFFLLRAGTRLRPIPGSASARTVGVNNARPGTSSDRGLIALIRNRPLADPSRAQRHRPSLLPVQRARRSSDTRPDLSSPCGLSSFFRLGPRCRCLKRRISDALYARLRADARQAAETPVAGPGGQPGNDSDSSAAGSHPVSRLFGQATPEPSLTLRPAATPAKRPSPTPTPKKTRRSP
jgi:hypothetical protein